MKKNYIKDFIKNKTLKERNLNFMEFKKDNFYENKNNKKKNNCSNSKIDSKKNSINKLETPFIYREFISNKNRENNEKDLIDSSDKLKLKKIYILKDNEDNIT